MHEEHRLLAFYSIVRILVDFDLNFLLYKIKTNGQCIV